MFNDQPSELDLLRKLQESTTSDIDEDRGTFKKGDSVLYQMFECGLTKADLLRMLGANEYAARLSHNESIAIIAEAIGEQVCRYSILFEDGFVINDVTPSELKENKVNEKYRCVRCGAVPAEVEGKIKCLKCGHEEVAAPGETLNIPPRESGTNEAKDKDDRDPSKPDLDAEEIGMEDYSEEDLEKVKSKSEESGNAIRAVDDKELKIEDETKKNESKVNEAIGDIPDDKLKELYANARKSHEHWKDNKVHPEKAKIAKEVMNAYEVELQRRGLMAKEGESVDENKVESEKRNESKFSFMNKQKALWLCNECFKTFRSDSGTCTKCSKAAEKISEGKDSDLALQSTMKKPFKVTWTDEAGKEQTTNVMAYDKSDAEREAKRPSRKDVKAEVIAEESKEVKGGDAPFEASLKEGVRELVGEVPGIDKEEQQALFKALEDGVISDEWPSDEQMVDELTKAGVDSEIANFDDLEDFRLVYLKHILLTKAMKPHLAAKTEDSNESDVSEEEAELYIGAPVKVLRGRSRGQIGEIIDIESPDEDPDGLGQIDVKLKDGRIIYLEWADVELTVDEPEDNVEEDLDEEVNDWDLTFKYKHNLIQHNPLMDKDGIAAVPTRISGKKVRVFSEYQANWVERNKGIAVRESVKEGKFAKSSAQLKRDVASSVAVEVAASTVDPDVYNLSIIEIPEGDKITVDTDVSKDALSDRGKKLARQLGAQFVGVVSEDKIEEEKDVLVTITGGEHAGKSGVVKNWVKGLGYQDVYFEGQKKQISYNYLKVASKSAVEFDKEVSEQFEDHEDKISGGKADNFGPDDFDPEQLEMGIEIEMEHTDDPTTAREIAMDHLREHPNYYTALKKMEDELKANESNDKIDANTQNEVLALYKKFRAQSRSREEAVQAVVKVLKIKVDAPAIRNLLMAKGVMEQEEETFTTVAKGLGEEDAKKMAQEKDGQVVTDEENPKKFAVIVREV